MVHRKVLSSTTKPQSVARSSIMGVAEIKDFIVSELRSKNPAIREANAALARSAALFLASVFVFRNFGDAFAV